jgi:hypothetical protein
MRVCRLGPRPPNSPRRQVGPLRPPGLPAGLRPRFPQGSTSQPSTTAACQSPRTVRTRGRGEEVSEYQGPHLPAPSGLGQVGRGERGVGGAAEAGLPLILYLAPPRSPFRPEAPDWLDRKRVGSSRGCGSPSHGLAPGRGRCPGIPAGGTRRPALDGGLVPQPRGGAEVGARSRAGPGAGPCGPGAGP